MYDLHCTECGAVMVIGDSVEAMYASPWKAKHEEWHRQLDARLRAVSERAGKSEPLLAGIQIGGTT